MYGFRNIDAPLTLQALMDRIVIAFLAGSAVFGALLIGELGDATDQPTALPDTARTKIPVAPAAQRPRPGELVSTILAQPLFSTTRRPPEQPMGNKAADPELPNIRLTGIVIDSDRHLAIFAVSGGKPLARGEGETINQWRLDSVEPNQVSLSGPTGITTLVPKSDPNLVRPKQIAQPAPNPARTPPVAARAPSPASRGSETGTKAAPPARPSTPAPVPAPAPAPAAPAPRAVVPGPISPANLPPPISAADR